MRRLITLLAGLALISTAAAAQGLGEAAQKEQERRKKAGAAGKVFTDDDLKQGGKPGTPARSGSAPAAGAGGTGGGFDESGAREQTEKYWRGRFAEVRAALRKAENAVAAAQAQVEAARNPMRAPTGPGRAPVAADATKFDPFDQRNTGGQALAKAEADLAKAQQDLETVRRALADLEEEARRKGVPPGWQRE